MRIPHALAQEWRDEPEWLAALPDLVTECAERWSLDLEDPVDTPHSLVVPAGEVVLKLNAPSHFEADQEVEALTCWAGAGAVRVVARNDGSRAFVMERCRPGTRLWDADADEADVVSELLPRLWVEPDMPHPFLLLNEQAERWAVDVPRRYELGGRPFERALLELAVDTFRNVGKTAGSLVNQDLHGGNVLRAEREPWLVIDPKPLVGERELNGVGILRNAVYRGKSSATSIRRWLDVLEGLGLDRERLRGWGVAHALAWGWNEQSGWSSRSVAAARAIHAA